MKTLYLTGIVFPEVTVSWLIIFGERGYYQVNTAFYCTSEQIPHGSKVKYEKQIY